MAEKQKASKKERYPAGVVATAKLRYHRSSPQKARLVANLIKGKRVEEALGVLKYTKKAVCRDMEKLLRSAMANAEQNEVKDPDRLFVSGISVDAGPSLKRIRARAMGRAFRIIKRMCHITLYLGEKA
jgi:large subunit ribosomal protein L22